MGEWVRERAREREREINRLDGRYGELDRCVRLKKIADMESISPYNLFDSLPKPFLKFYSALRPIAPFYPIFSFQRGRNFANLVKCFTILQRNYKAALTNK